VSDPSGQPEADGPPPDPDGLAGAAASGSARGASDSTGEPSDSTGDAIDPPGIEDAVFAQRAVYLDSPETLIVADCHVGRDAGTNLELPLGERGTLVERLDALLDRFEPDHVVVAGDLLDAFGSVPDTVRETVQAIEDAVTATGATLTVATGNHDTMLDAVFSGDRVPAVELTDGTVVSHGAEPPATSGTRYVIGHDHPMLRIAGRKYPCALVGPAAGRDAPLIVLPAFSPLTRGTAINRLRASDLQSRWSATSRRFIRS
jgi:metallophosphoesterase superfamily enzyme